jgi:hypothetical protein
LFRLDEASPELMSWLDTIGATRVEKELPSEARSVNDQVIRQGEIVPTRVEKELPSEARSGNDQVIRQQGDVKIVPTSKA